MQDHASETYNNGRVFKYTRMTHMNSLTMDHINNVDYDYVIGKVDITIYKKK